MTTILGKHLKLLSHNIWWNILNYFQIQNFILVQGSLSTITIHICTNNIVNTNIIYEYQYYIKNTKPSTNEHQIIKTPNLLPPLIILNIYPQLILKVLSRSREGVRTSPRGRRWWQWP